MVDRLPPAGRACASSEAERGDQTRTAHGGGRGDDLVQYAPHGQNRLPDHGRVHRDGRGGRAAGLDDVNTFLVMLARSTPMMTVKASSCKRRCPTTTRTAGLKMDTYYL